MPTDDEKMVRLSNIMNAFIAAHARVSGANAHYACLTEADLNIQCICYLVELGLNI